MSTSSEPSPEYTLQIYRTASLSPSQAWAWRLRARNRKIVATSGEGYTSREHCETMALRLFPSLTPMLAGDDQ